MDAFFNDLIITSRDIELKLGQVKDNVYTPNKALHKSHQQLKDLTAMVNLITEAGISQQDNYLKKCHDEFSLNQATLSIIKNQFKQTTETASLSKSKSSLTDKENNDPKSSLTDKENNDPTITTDHSPLDDYSFTKPTDISLNMMDPLQTPPPRITTRNQYEREYEVLKTPSLADFGGMSDATRAILQGIAPDSPEEVKFSEETTVTLNFDIRALTECEMENNNNNNNDDDDNDNNIEDHYDHDIMGNLDVSGIADDNDIINDNDDDLFNNDNNDIINDNDDDLFNNDIIMQEEVLPVEEEKEEPVEIIQEEDIHIEAVQEESEQQQHEEESENESENESPTVIRAQRLKIDSKDNNELIKEQDNTCTLKYIKLVEEDDLNGLPSYLIRNASVDFLNESIEKVNGEAVWQAVL